MATPKKRTSSKHYKDSRFLKALGGHCKKLRTQKGYSIDRMSKESEQLSTSVIHRLEKGDAPVSISVLARYASVLEVHPKKLLDFDYDAEVDSDKIEILHPDHSRVRSEAFRSLLPVYSLKAAAGYFGNGQSVEPKGWIEVKLDRALDKQMFVVQAVGKSMLPKIGDGDYLVMRANPIGTRQGKIVLAQYRGLADSETGGSYTIKKYSSVKVVSPSDGWRHTQIVLSPLNSAFEPIILLPKDEQDFRVLAEYIATLS